MTETTIFFNYCLDYTNGQNAQCAPQQKFPYFPAHSIPTLGQAETGTVCFPGNICYREGSGPDHSTNKESYNHNAVKDRPTQPPSEQVNNVIITCFQKTCPHGTSNSREKHKYVRFIRTICDSY